MARQAPQQRMGSVPPPNLPPVRTNVSFSDSRRPPRPAPGTSAADMPLDDNIGPEDEFGYELILNKNKMKKEDLNPPPQRESDELWGPDINAPAAGDDFVHPRERAAFEQNGNAGPALPPRQPTPSAFRPLSAPRMDGQQPFSFGGTNNWN